MKQQNKTQKSSKTEKLDRVSQTNNQLTESTTPKQSNFQKFSRIKQLIIDIRQRKSLIQQVPNPKIVASFQQMHLAKSCQIKKKQLVKKIELKKKQYLKLKKQLELYKQKYSQKSDSLKQRPHLIRVLTSKLQNEYEKTRDRYRQIDFNQNLINGVKKVSFYRLAQIFFNENSRNIFSVIESMSRTNLMPSNQDMSTSTNVQSMLPKRSMAIMNTKKQVDQNRFQSQQNQVKSRSIEQRQTGFTFNSGKDSNNLSGSGNSGSWRKIEMVKSDQQFGICLGYLGLLITLVGEIAGARMWINFTFKGARSTIRLSDGSSAYLNYRDRRINEALGLLTEQLYQIMRYNLGININPTLRKNFYYLVDDLSKFLMS